MIKITKSISIALFIFILNSSFTIYTPTALYTPLLKANNELNLSAALGLLGTGMWNFNAAYALNDHSGIILSGMIDNNNHISGVKNGNQFHIIDIEVFRKNAIEIGGGYFLPYGSKHNKLFQLYSGIGIGSVYDKFTERNVMKYDVQSQFMNVFLQVGLAITRKHIESAFDIKTKQVFAYKIHGTILPYSEGPESPEYVSLNEQKSFLQIEPTYTLKAGNENMKGIIQFGFGIGHGYANFGTENPVVSSFPLFEMLNMFRFSLGLSYTFRHKTD